ncbi:hypothetical protein GOBAR_DD25443 [Gossypium barbadense]|nr:hypothetical protein GOBAR_DD25443 [Gossypium barbadense]
MNIDEDALQVMKHFGQDDAAVQKKMEEMNNELQEKIDDLQDLESTNKALIYKERQSNDELHEAREVLIQGLPGLLGNRTNIGLKRMGELDPKAFHDTCKSRFPPDEAEIQATTLCSSWQENLKNPDWHPIFRKANKSKAGMGAELPTYQVQPASSYARMADEREIGSFQTYIFDDHHGWHIIWIMEYKNGDGSIWTVISESHLLGRLVEIRRESQM